MYIQSWVLYPVLGRKHTQHRDIVTFDRDVLTCSLIRQSKDLIASFRLTYQRAHEDVMVKSYDAPKSSVFYLLLNPVILGSLGVSYGYGRSSSNIS